MKTARILASAVSLCIAGAAIAQPRPQHQNVPGEKPDPSDKKPPVYGTELPGKEKTPYDPGNPNDPGTNNPDIYNTPYPVPERGDERPEPSPNPDAPLPPDIYGNPIGDDTLPVPGPDDDPYYQLAPGLDRFSTIGAMIDLRRGEIHIFEPSISIQQDAIDTNMDGFHEAVLGISFDQTRTPNSRPKFRAARLVLIYDRKPQGWTVNVGDSISNDGNGGDAGHQSRNAELQIRDDRLRLFASEPYTAPILNQEVPISHAALEVTIADQRVEVGQLALDFRKGPQVLFNLKNRRDAKGLPNSTIFVGLNRVVGDTAPDRIGSGLAHCLIVLD